MIRVIIVEHQLNNFQLYDDQNKLHFDDDDVRFVLDQHAELAFIVLAH